MADGAVNGATLDCRTVDDLIVLYFVQLEDISTLNSIAIYPKLTLTFKDSIRFGFKAPVARPKSVSLTCPVPSTRKFYSGIGMTCDKKPSIYLLTSGLRSR